MISAIQPVSLPLLPPVRRSGEDERLALPAPQTAETAAEPLSTRQIRTVSEAYAARQETRASRRLFALDDGPTFSTANDVRPHRLSADGVMTVHAFALTPSLTIEPYGEVARAYAQTQALGNGSRLTVDFSV